MTTALLCLVAFGAGVFGRSAITYGDVDELTYTKPSSGSARPPHQFVPPKNITVPRVPSGAFAKDPGMKISP